MNIQGGAIEFSPPISKAKYVVAGMKTLLSHPVPLDSLGNMQKNSEKNPGHVETDAKKWTGQKSGYQ